MIYTDDTAVKIDGVLLPGLIKSFEIKGAATIEEQAVEGSSKSPKQVTGYDDLQVTIELTLEDGPTLTARQKYQTLAVLYRKPGQTKPSVHTIVNQHTAAHNLSKVIIKSIDGKQLPGMTKITATLELLEYNAITIAASKSASGGSQKSNKTSSSTTGLSSGYQSYLKTRGQAPKQTSKASQTSLADKATVTYPPKTWTMLLDGSASGGSR